MMSDPRKPATRMLYDSTPSSRQAIKFLTAATIGTIFLVSSGLTLTGTVLVLILSTPILILFSPVLVPAVTSIFLVTAGFLFSGSCVATAVGALLWMYRYVKGKQPPGAEQLDYVRDKIAETVREMKEKTKEYGQSLQTKTQEMMTSTTAQEGS